MFMLAERPMDPETESAGQFWIDPDAKVGLTAHINEPHATPGKTGANGTHPGASQELMDCYNCDNE